MMRIRRGRGRDEEEEEEEQPTPTDSVHLYTIPSPPLPASPPASVLPALPPASPIRLLGYRAAMIRLRAETPSDSHPLPLPISSPPLYEIERVQLQLPLDRLEVVGQTMGLSVLWIPRLDDREPRRSAMGLETFGLTELTAVQEQDTQDIYAVIGDTQDNQEALVFWEAWGCSIKVSYMARSELMALRSIVMGTRVTHFKKGDSTAGTAGTLWRSSIASCTGGGR
ncbi:hypothetical protein Tco_1347109 [Tanacetum coccineum]